ncbi:MAG TPA: hypothetical protein ENJ68_06560, partial [Devosia sp.]|nr:hypothetical protein [Devosia sp.]
AVGGTLAQSQQAPQPQTKSADQAGQPAETGQPAQTGLVQIGEILDGQALFKSECSDCHYAYPANFLPSASWQAILSNLSDHFGEDASLDPDVASAIEGFLVTHSSNPARIDVNNPPLRITELSWFRRQHSEGEVGYMKRTRNVKTMSDCLACHVG